MSLNNNRFRNLLPLVAMALVAVAILGAPTQARADFEIRFSTDGGATFSTPVSDNGPGDNNSTVGVISVNIDGLSITATTSGGTSATFSNIDLQVQQIGAGTSAAGNVVVQASLDGLLTVPSPQTLTNRFTDNTLPANGDVATGETWIANGSGNFVTSGGSLVLNTGTVNPSPTPTDYSFSASTPYTITTQVHTVFIAGADLQLDNNNQITGAPAPAGLLLALTGLPVLSIWTWLRRRQNRVAAHQAVALTGSVKGNSFRQGRLS